MIADQIINLTEDIALSTLDNGAKNNFKTWQVV